MTSYWDNIELESDRNHIYDDVSRSPDYPKTLMIRNHVGGLVWQVYHVRDKSEADRLGQNANGNGFWGSTLEDYQPDMEETWPDWREKCGWANPFL